MKVSLALDNFYLFKSQKLSARMSLTISLFSFSYSFYGINTFFYLFFYFFLRFYCQVGLDVYVLYFIYEHFICHHSNFTVLEGAGLNPEAEFLVILCPCI
jgi:hypothetical protein